MTIIDKYIFRSVVKTSMAALFFLVILFTFFKFLEELNEIGNQNYSFETMLQYLFFLLPSFFNSFSILAIMIGIIFSIGTLNSNRELQILQVGSISYLSLIKKIIRFTFIFSLIFISLTETIHPSFLKIAKQIKNEALGKIVNNQNKDYWLKVDNKFVFIKDINNELNNFVGIFTVDKEHNLVSYSKGKDIEVSSDGLVFENLSHLEVKRVKDLNFLQSKKNNTSYQINLDKSELYSFKDDVKTMDMIQLIVSLNAKVKSGLNSNEILYEIMSRIIKPFTLLSMVLIALPLILTQDRAISLGNKIFIAISIGVITHLLIKISSVIAIKINVISYIGPLIPTVVLTLTGLVLLKRNLKKIY